MGKFPEMREREREIERERERERENKVKSTLFGTVNIVHKFVRLCDQRFRTRVEALEGV